MPCGVRQMDRVPWGNIQQVALKGCSAVNGLFSKCSYCESQGIASRHCVIVGTIRKWAVSNPSQHEYFSSWNIVR